MKKVKVENNIFVVALSKERKVRLLYAAAG